MVGVFVFHDSATSPNTVEAIRDEISEEIYAPLTTVSVENLGSSEIAGEVSRYLADLSKDGCFVVVGLGATAGAVRMACTSNDQVVGLVLVEHTGLFGNEDEVEHLASARIVGSRQDESFMSDVKRAGPIRVPTDQLWLIEDPAYKGDGREMTSALVRGIADAASPLVNSYGIEHQLRGPRPVEMGATHIVVGRESFDATVECVEGSLHLTALASELGVHSSLAYRPTPESGGFELTSVQSSFSSAMYFLRESLIVAMNQLPANPSNGSFSVFLAALAERWSSPQDEVV